jgi:hypothetical protein
MGLSAGLMFVLLIMNRNREKERVANGKPAKLHNASMDKEYTQNTDSDLGKQAFADLTDRQNDEFVYGY